MPDILDMMGISPELMLKVFQKCQIDHEFHNCSNRSCPSHDMEKWDDDLEMYRRDPEFPRYGPENISFFTEADPWMDVPIRRYGQEHATAWSEPREWDKYHDRVVDGKWEKHGHELRVRIDDEFYVVNQWGHTHEVNLMYTTGYTCPFCGYEPAHGATYGVSVITGELSLYAD